MVMIRGVVGVAMQRPSQIFLNAVCVAVFGDDRGVVLNGFEHRRGMRHGRHQRPAQHRKTEQSF